MTLVRRASPFGELLSLRQAMDRLFDDSLIRPMSWAPVSATSGPALDVYADADALVVVAALPGVDPQDVDITIDGKALSIRGAYRSERSTDDGYLVKEIRRGTFTRSVSLPDDLEAAKASASFENGLLRLRIPKSQENKPKQIKITPATAEIPADAKAG